VYVDSGSSDDSVNVARSRGIEVIELNPALPFSAARARNEGFSRLSRLHPDLRYVQFVDGDCQLRADWLGNAAEFLGNHTDTAVVSGRLREKNPGNSIYNTLCDIEWDVPAGNAQDCGGIAMMWASAFEGAQGFRIDLIAGEEPELCVRLRMQGWKIWRLDGEMALHDADITQFRQWWTRTRRGGYAVAQGAALHGTLPERFRVRESRSILTWGLALPLFALGLIATIGLAGLLSLVVYPLQIVRLAVRGARTGRENWLNAVFLVIGKFPATLGLLEYYAQRKLRRQPKLVEYK
jgi:GT2 family glycosyltransferase